MYVLFVLLCLVFSAYMFLLVSFNSKLLLKTLPNVSYRLWDERRNYECVIEGNSIVTEWDSSYLPLGNTCIKGGWDTRWLWHERPNVTSHQNFSFFIHFTACIQWLSFKQNLSDYELWISWKIYFMCLGKIPIKYIFTYFFFFF